MKHISDKASRDSNFNAHFYTGPLKGACDSTYADRLYTTNGVTSSFPIPVYSMLNKNTLGVKKCEANQKPQWLYKRPKTLISSKAKKLNILLRILSLE